MEKRKITQMSKNKREPCLMIIITMVMINFLNRLLFRSNRNHLQSSIARIEITTYGKKYKPVAKNMKYQRKNAFIQVKVKNKGSF